MGGVVAGIDTFGMAGTRPTGWGRYTGLSALVCLAMAVFKNKKSKIIWSGLFLIFLLILLFSRGKTELIAFSAAAAIFLFLFKKYKMSLIFFAMLLFFVISIFVFHTPNLLCSDRVLSSISAIKLNIVSADQTNINLDTTIKEIITLSGRTNGIWRNAWDYFKKSPLIGHGFHSDRLSFGHTHNTLLQALVQSGLLGAIFFVFALAFAVLMLLNLLKSGYLLGSEKIFFAGLIGVLLFFFIRGITESFAYFSADWIFVAPIIAYIQYLYQRIRSENKQKKLDFCGFKIDAVKMPEVLEKINYWVKNETHKHHWIIVTGMHGVVEASKYADFKYVLSQADLWVPDGISLVWLAQSKGFNIKERVSGADLMQEVLKKDYKNFLYGDKEETLLVVKNKFPNSKIDFYPPPFSELTPEEDEKIIEKINSTKPDILWVGLGLPKQEKWIYRHKDRLNAPVIIGVGAAFKFLAGTKKRAPKWMGSIGLEWLWRLLTEPKVVWKRVFIEMPYFF